MGRGRTDWAGEEPIAHDQPETALTQNAHGRPETMSAQTNAAELATAQERGRNETPDLAESEGMAPFSGASAASEFTSAERGGEFFIDIGDCAENSDRYGERSGAPPNVIKREIKERSSEPATPAYKPGRAGRGVWPRCIKRKTIASLALPRKM